MPPTFDILIRIHAYANPGCHSPPPPPPQPSAHNCSWDVQVRPASDAIKTLPEFERNWKAVFTDALVWGQPDTAALLSCWPPGRLEFLPSSKIERAAKMFSSFRPQEWSGRQPGEHHAGTRTWVCRVSPVSPPQRDRTFHFGSIGNKVGCGLITVESA